MLKHDDIRLTEHFLLSELTESCTARRYGIDNTPSAEQVRNLRNLCEKVLEPLRMHFGVAVRVSSGYRSPELNRRVGGASNSQHQTGQAADIRVSDSRTGREWMEWIITECEFDQCIWETADGVTFWIHISCCRNSSENRGKVVKFLKKVKFEGENEISCEKLQPFCDSTGLYSSQ